MQNIQTTKDYSQAFVLFLDMLTILTTGILVLAYTHNCFQRAVVFAESDGPDSMPATSLQMLQLARKNKLFFQAPKGRAEKVVPRHSNARTDRTQHRKPHQISRLFPVLSLFLPF